MFKGHEKVLSTRKRVDIREGNVAPLRFALDDLELAREQACNAFPCISVKGPRYRNEIVVAACRVQIDGTEIGAGSDRLHSSKDADCALRTQSDSDFLDI